MQQLPGCVVFARKRDEVRDVLRLANETGTPVAANAASHTTARHIVQYFTDFMRGRVAIDPLPPGSSDDAGSKKTGHHRASKEAKKGTF